MVYLPRYEAIKKQQDRSNLFSNGVRRFRTHDRFQVLLIFLFLKVSPHGRVVLYIICLFSLPSPKHYWSHTWPKTWPKIWAVYLDLFRASKQFLEGVARIFYVFFSEAVHPTNWPTTVQKQFLNADQRTSPKPFPKNWKVQINQSELNLQRQRKLPHNISKGSSPWIRGLVLGSLRGKNIEKTSLFFCAFAQKMLRKSWVYYYVFIQQLWTPLLVFVAFSHNNGAKALLALLCFRSAMLKQLYWFYVFFLQNCEKAFVLHALLRSETTVLPTRPEGLDDWQGARGQSKRQRTDAKGPY